MSGFPAPFDSSLWGQTKAQIVDVNSFEIGYSGIIGEKLKVNIDFFTYNRKGFTNTTNVGPTIGAINTDVPGALFSTISADVLNSAALQAVVTGGLTQQYAGIAALTGQDIANVNAGLVPGVPAFAVAYAQAIGGLAAAAAGLFEGAGLLYNERARVQNGFQPIFGAVESPQAPDNDGWLNTAFGYRNFGNATRKHWGTDIELEYFASSKLTYFANFSWVSKNWWAVGDDGMPFSTSLDSPMHKYRAGIDYVAGMEGLRFSLAYQYDSAFNSDSALYGGEVQEKNLFDMNIGWKFNEKMRFDISGTNIFDKKYRSFPGMPVIGRRMLGKITYSF